MYIFIIVEILLHVLEELPRFPAWATEHFGTTTIGWYLFSHALLLPLASYIVLKANKYKTSAWSVLAVAIQTLLATNGVFHIATTVLFREYSPGVVSSMLITIPYSIYFYRRVLLLKTISRSVLVRAIMLGTFISILCVASLYLDIGFI